MRFITCLAVCVLLLFVCIPAFAQSMESGTDMGLLKIDWARQGNDYIFTLINPERQSTGYSVLGWSLEVANIPEPVSVTCPQGWEWSNNGNWGQFSVSQNSKKYVVGGAAIEPGESLKFTYSIGSGIASNDPQFLTHVAAVNGQDKGKWIAYTPKGLSQTWHDIPAVKNITTQSNSVPEPAGSVILFCNFIALACLKYKRARV